MAFLVRTKKRHFSTWWQSYGIVATSDVGKAPKCGIKRHFWILQRLGDKLVELVIFIHYFTLLDNQKWLKTRVIAAFSLKICVTCKFGINICDNISNWRDHSLVCPKWLQNSEPLLGLACLRSVDSGSLGRQWGQLRPLLFWRNEKLFEIGSKLAFWAHKTQYLLN
jgi:hypothetical protein